MMTERISNMRKFFVEEKNQKKEESKKKKKNYEHSNLKKLGKPENLKY